MISLTVNGLSKFFGKTEIFTNLSFYADDCILGIQGPNGSGKSTLLKCLAGLYTPTSGEIKWNVANEEINTKEIRFRCGYAAPYLNLYDELTVFENLSFLSKARAQKLSEEQAGKILDDLGLLGRLHQPFKKLSSGQQQRVKLSAAFSGNPAVLILDEPGTNLDDDGKTLIFDAIRNARKNGSFVILASNVSDELAVCDKLVSLPS